MEEIKLKYKILSENLIFHANQKAQKIKNKSIIKNITLNNLFLFIIYYLIYQLYVF